jgi:hypothetical protein
LKNKNSSTIGGVCTDWATLVVTFSNILGCRLQLARFEAIEGPFTLNASILIGSDENDWRSRSTASSKISDFDNHVVAAQAADIPDQYSIYDACLAVDVKSSSSPPYTPLVASNMVFGPLSNPESYLHHLVDAKERENLHFFVHKAGKTYPRFFPITKL